MELVNSASLSEISLIIPGKPKPKQGSQTRLIHSEAGIKAVHYTPTDVENWSAYVRYCVSAYKQVPLWTGPIKLDVVLYVIRAKSRKGEVWATSRPDFDNIFKNLCDSMQGIIYANDSCICDASFKKYFSDDLNQLEVKLARL